VTEKKYTIMFVCTGNTCRSPMAEGALRVLLEKDRPGKAHVISSGTAAADGFPATHFAIEAAKIWEADISDHQSQPLMPALIERADLIFAMTVGHLEEILRLRPDLQDKVYLFKNFPDHAREGEEVADPIGQTLDRYNATFIELGEYLGRHQAEIVKRIDEFSDDDK
jgi:protein-tyrosine phosphatase